VLVKDAPDVERLMPKEALYICKYCELRIDRQLNVILTYIFKWKVKDLSPSSLMSLNFLHAPTEDYVAQNPNVWTSMKSTLRVNNFRLVV
jgi:hypothetical protein